MNVAKLGGAPSTRLRSVTVMPVVSSSRMRADTVTGSLARGITGRCLTFSTIGAMSFSATEFPTPGVPPLFKLAAQFCPY
ncbi:MAG: hypothetical protein ACYSU5_16165 [Planctomycetota bacterium]